MYDLILNNIRNDVKSNDSILFQKHIIEFRAISQQLKNNLYSSFASLLAVSEFSPEIGPNFDYELERWNSNNFSFAIHSTFLDVMACAYFQIKSTTEKHVLLDFLEETTQISKNTVDELISLLNKAYGLSGVPVLIINWVSESKDNIQLVPIEVINYGAGIASNAFINVGYDNKIFEIEVDSIYVGDLKSGEKRLLNLEISDRKNIDSQLDFSFINLIPKCKNAVCIPYTIPLDINQKKLANIEGFVKYYSDSHPIDNVDFAIEGNHHTTYTSSSFEYSIPDFQVGENYDISISKSQDSDIGFSTISMYDAAITAQVAQGVRQFSSYQYMAADANKDNKITIFDATHIAQYALEQIRSYDSHVGEWLFDPPNRSYNPLNESLTGQDFTGILIGDVDGNWSPPGTLQKENIQNLNLNLEVTHLKENEIMVSVPYTRLDDLNSMELTLKFDSSILEFIAVEKTSLIENSQLFHNKTDGLINVGMFSFQPIEKKGKLICFKFEIKNRDVNTTDLHFSNFVINDGPKYIFSTSVQLNESNLPEEYTLEQNYPNPFNGTTTIKFGLPEVGNVSIQIYNILGKNIKTLCEEKYFEAGNHKITWDGKHENGNSVSSGIYFCELLTNGRRKLIKMVYVQ